MKEADEDLWKFDIREINSKNLVQELETFGQKAEAVDAANDNRNQGLLRMFTRNVKKLDERLQEDWNTSLKVKQPKCEDIPAAGSEVILSAADGNWKFHKPTPKKKTDRLGS